ncbi:MAG: sugar transferase [Hyphomicrobiales bacterium]
MISSTIPAVVFWAALVFVVYNHIVFPLLTRYGARLIRAVRTPVPVIPIIPADKDLPSIAIVVPAYNEEKYIAGKIKNLSQLDYPADKLSIIIASDGSTDLTMANAKAAIADVSTIDIDIREYTQNTGKTAVLNRVMRHIDADIVVFSDVSSVVEPNILKRFAGHFVDEKIGVVSGAYRLDAPASNGERAYWDFQIALKRDENTIAAMMGAHGAFYAIRGRLYEPLEADTINDDFVIPMRIVAQGYRTVYDTAVVVRELEPTNSSQDFQRRLRISQGAMQQMMRLTALFNWKRPHVAAVFASGKVLRALVPFLLVLMAVTSFVLTMQGVAFYGLPLTGMALLVAMGLLQLQDNLECLPKPMHPIAYLAAGHMAGLIGGARYLFHMGGYNKAEVREEAELEMGFISSETRACKRLFDILIASICLIGFVVLFPFIAFAIKMDSAGPIFYRQLRVGARTETQSKLFRLFKFRTMSIDAEKSTGAIWAKKNDNRITRVGNFLRKTRLDEIPQCLNVLQGDMSIVGPRPERPVFFGRLEREIPFYSERTYGIRPGITGLAQVMVGYDECVEDVRQKVLHDHVYATRLGRLMEWMKTDISICFRTFAVVILGKGQ